MLEAIDERFPTAAIQPSIKLDWQTAADLPPVEVGMAVIDPMEDAQP